MSAPVREAITIREAGARLSVSRRTIYNYLKAGKLDYVRTPGGAIRILVDSLWREPERVVAPHETPS